MSAPEVGWISEDEEGAWMIDSESHDDAGVLDGYWLMGPKGVERFVSVERAQCYPWRAPR